MEIYVRSRKYGTMIDTSGFGLSDGPDKVYDLSRFQVGDKITLFVELTEAQHIAVNDIGGVGLHSYGNPGRYVSDIQFLVVEKRHYMGLRKPLEMSWSGSQIVIEAETDHCEDLYLLVTQGIKPSWAGDDD